MKITGKMIADFCVELDKLEGQTKETCQAQKTKVLTLARVLGFIVGKNGQKIQIHTSNIVDTYDETTLLAEFFINNKLRIVVNSDKLWNIAEGMEIQEAGDF